MNALFFVIFHLGLRNFDRIFQIWSGTFSISISFRFKKLIIDLDSISNQNPMFLHKNIHHWFPFQYRIFKETSDYDIIHESQSVFFYHIFTSIFLPRSPWRLCRLGSGNRRRIDRWPDFWCRPTRQPKERIPSANHETASLDKVITNNAGLPDSKTSRIWNEKTRVVLVNDLIDSLDGKDKWR